MRLLPSCGIRIWILGSALIASLSFVYLPSAGAQSAPEHRWEAFAEFGGSFYTGVSRDLSAALLGPPAPGLFEQHLSFAKTGRSFVGVRFSLSANNQVEASYSYTPGRTRSIETGPFTLIGSISVPFQADFVSFNYVRRFSNGNRVRPFVTAGAGFVAFSESFQTDYAPTGNFGMGLDIRLNGRLDFRVEQRAYILGGAPRAFSGVSSSGTVLNYVPSAGLVLHF